jgi:Polyketide cyclase / dehydrase and lipid transport
MNTVIKTVTGNTKDFSCTVSTRSDKAHFWQIWTDVGGWPRWDTPLKAATLEGELRVGATGSLTTKNGQTSNFTITECQPMHSYTFRTNLPGAALSVQRSITREHDDGRLEFTHRVRFTGALGGVFAAILGPSFMRQLPEVMHELQWLAEDG